MERLAPCTRSKGRSLSLLIIRNLFRYVYAHIAPLGHRQVADPVRVQGSLMKVRDQRKLHHVGGLVVDHADYDDDDDDNNKRCKQYMTA